MTRTDATFQEAGARPAVRSVPLSHLSIEVGHLYFEDFRAGPAALQSHFEQVAPWVRAGREIAVQGLSGRTPRISTCFLIDDYFGPSSPPDEVVPALLAAAGNAGVRIDYLARESACARADGVPLAELVTEQIVAEPAPRTTGSRPPATEAGWLCNGQRSPAGTSAAAMEPAQPWQAPSQNAANRHSVFVDVELWSSGADGRLWSCAFLATVWQLLRLGMIRHRGEPVATAQDWDGRWPDRWDELPAVLRLEPTAAPFSAYRSLSVLPRRFFATENAVRTILDQVAVDETVVTQVLARARGEGLRLRPEAGDRIDYVFTG